MPSPSASDAIVEPKGSPCSAPRSTSSTPPAGSCTTAGSRWAHSVQLLASGKCLATDARIWGHSIDPNMF
eukprot:1301503-Karenia_brevis.AAC.1